MKLFGREKINNLKIFHGIQDEIVDDILSAAQREAFAPWSIIMEQWDHPNGSGYIIEDGSVDVWVNGESVAKLTPWDMFWEIALLNEEPRTATVVAESEVIAIVLSQEILFQMLENDNNSINKEIMRRMEENLENE